MVTCAVARQGSRSDRDLRYEPPVATPQVTSAPSPAQPVRELVGRLDQRAAAPPRPGSGAAGRWARRHSSSRSRRRARCAPGLAMAVSPTSSSSTATAYPCSRTTSSCLRRAALLVIVSPVYAGQPAEQVLELGLAQPGHQHLAVAGRVQRDVLADPVVWLQRRGAGDLVEVEGAVAAERGQVDRLAGRRGQLLAQRTRFLDDVEPGTGGPGEAEQADAEAVLPASLDLLDEAVLLEGGDQPEGRALVDLERRRDLGDAGLAGAGEDLEDPQRPVDRLDPAGRLRGRRCSWRNRRLHSATRLGPGLARDQMRSYHAMSRTCRGVHRRRLPGQPGSGRMGLGGARRAPGLGSRPGHDQPADGGPGRLRGGRRAPGSAGGGERLDVRRELLQELVVDRLACPRLAEQRQEAGGQP